MKKGIVVDVHPGDHSVDLVLSDGRRLTGVQVATPNGSTRSGTFDLPAVPPKADKWDITKITGQDQIALVEFIDGVPVVVGFLFPQINQMTFDDPRRRVVRHQSDVISSIDGDGNIQLTHPSGTYVRIGETPAREDLSGKDTDKKLNADRNTGRRVNIRIGMAGNTLTLTMTPDGAVFLDCAEGINFRSAKGITFEASEKIGFKAPGGMAFETPNAHFSERATAGGDFVAGPGVSLVDHTHPNLMPGPAQSPPPTPDDSSDGPSFEGADFPSS